MEVWGAVDRTTHYVVYCTYDKVNDQGDHRAGPASCAEVLPLIKRHIKRGTKLLSDGFLAYNNCLEAEGYTHDKCIHSKGENVAPHDHTVHKQTLMVLGVTSRIKSEQGKVCLKKGSRGFCTC